MSAKTVVIFFIAVWTVALATKNYDICTTNNQRLHVADGASISLISPQFPQKDTNYTDCHVTIVTAENANIKFAFVGFAAEDGHSVLSILDGPTLNDTELVKHSGISLRSGHLNITGNEVTIRYTSDDISGFKMVIYDERRDSMIQKCVQGMFNSGHLRLNTKYACLQIFLSKLNSAKTAQKKLENERFDGVLSKVNESTTKLEELENQRFQVLSSQLNETAIALKTLKSTLFTKEEMTIMLSALHDRR